MICHAPAVEIRPTPPEVREIQHKRMILELGTTRIESAGIGLILQAGVQRSRPSFGTCKNCTAPTELASNLRVMSRCLHASVKLSGHL